MGLFRARPIRRTADGTYAVELEPDVRELVGSFVDQLRQLLATDSDLLVRLFPPPYGDDEERNAGYAILAGSELRDHRLAALEVVSEHLDATELDEEQLMAWMRSINDIRLVMGTMLGIEDDDLGPDPDDEDEPAHRVYEFFGWLLETIVAALAD